MNKCKLPYKLQFFAGEIPETPPEQPAQQQQQTQQTNTTVDYEKIQQMLDGTLKAKEDTALKAYFKEQGLSQQEAEQAIATFKQQKASSQPDIAGLQTQTAQAQAAAQKAMIENAAILSAVELGIDAKTIPYMLRLAELGNVMGTDGKVNDEALKKALNKVLEDVPALKPSASQLGGFRLGASDGGTHAATDEAALKAAFGITT